MAIDILATIGNTFLNWGANKIISSITGEESRPTAPQRGTQQVASASPISVASEASKAATARQQAGLAASQVDSFQSMKNMVDFVTPKVDIDSQRKQILSQLRRDGASEQFIQNLKQQWSLNEKALLEPKVAVDTSGFAQKPIRSA